MKKNRRGKNVSFGVANWGVKIFCAKIGWFGSPYFCALDGIKEIRFFQKIGFLETE
jgi:hypothetical protein